MNSGLTLAHAVRLSGLSDEQLSEWLGKCRPSDLLLMDAMFELWAQQCRRRARAGECG